MTSDPEPGEPRRARRVSKEIVRPESVAERQESLIAYLIRRQRASRDRFVRRSEAFSLRKELGRNLFLAGCLLLDVLLAPYPIFLWPGVYGWVAAGVAIVAALFVEYRVYADLFSVPPAPETEVEQLQEAETRMGR